MAINLLPHFRFLQNQSAADLNITKEQVVAFSDGKQLLLDILPRSVECCCSLCTT